MSEAPTKLRPLYIMQILLERTDEEHILNASEICRILEQKYDMKADRRTIYNEIANLQNFGLDIIQKKGTNPGYYVGSRQFELAELKLLVDVVQSAKFITEKKSKELIRKLEQLCSESEAKQLSRQVTISNRPKTTNETIYYNVDRIHSAIYHDKQISFQYAEWTPKKELRLKKNGDYYVVSPQSLIWDDENYYLVAHDEKDDRVKHYRVDKMKNMTILEADRTGREGQEEFNLAAFSKKTFGMFGGEDHEVTLRCQNHLAGVVLDRFGPDIWMRPDGKDHFIARVNVTVSPQFFGWVAGIGSHMVIEGSEEIRAEYKKYLTDIMASYE